MLLNLNTLKCFDQTVSCHSNETPLRIFLKCKCFW